MKFFCLFLFLSVILFCLFILSELLDRIVLNVHSREDPICHVDKDTFFLVTPQSSLKVDFLTIFMCFTLDHLKESIRAYVMEL